MKKLITSLALATTQIVPVWGSVVNYENHLPQSMKIVPRVESGSIEPRVHEIHTNKGTGETAVKSYDANIGHLNYYCQLFKRANGRSDEGCALKSRYIRN